jgi:fatty-acyl-CoA synthase
VGGENVSPAEVEEVLRDVSGLKQVCVLAVPHERLGEVAAAVVISEGEVVWPAVLLEVKNRLANFKVPREIYVTDAFPMTATNKVQRSVLQKQIADGKFTRVS